MGRHSLWLSEHSVHHRINQLFLHLDTRKSIFILLVNAPNALSEKTIGDAQHVGFVDNGDFGRTVVTVS